MRRLRYAIVALLLLGLGAAVLRAMPPATGPIYQVPALQAALHGGGWEGRTVRVRGTARRCPIDAYCLYPLFLATAAGDAFIGLDLGGREGPLATLRDLPLLGLLLPGPQRLRWGVPATYRVRIVRQRQWNCTPPPCYGAVLLDAAPAP